MRENNRKPIENCRKKLPQFTTMNVIDGQAGLAIYSSLIFYSLTIDNILNIIVLLILAAVAINLSIGDNGLITKAMQTAFLTEMAQVEEGVQMWKASQEGETIPTNGLYSKESLEKTERLKGEIGYYRQWNSTDTMPRMSIYTESEEFNSEFEGELVYFPAGIQDLYYLNNKSIGIRGNKKYIIDASNGMIYSEKGITLKGITAYSSAMAKSLINGESIKPTFLPSETSGTGSEENLAGNAEAEYGFKIIASRNNVFKLYNNGDLYGKGVKGIQLNTSEEEMEAINDKKWQKFEVPTIIPGASTGNIQIYPGYKTVYVIDEQGYLWAWGENTNNNLGLTQEQLIEYNGMEPVKLNVDGKKVKIVYPGISHYRK